MELENILDKSKLIDELKVIHGELVGVYKKIFNYKYQSDENFKTFIDKEYKENGVGSKEKKAWNDNFCHRASYTLLNKILFVRICEDKGFMLNPEDYIAGEPKNPHIGKKLCKIGLQKWANLVTNYTLGELIKFAFHDMKKSYNNIVLYKEDKYEVLNPTDEELSLKYLRGDERTRQLVLEFENVLNNIVEKLDTNNFNFKNTDGNILGDVYEKFMDRETRKAIGQFYTPEFVIEYILKNTVAEVDVVENPFVSVADISCGSGHFLIMAYDILREKFINNLEKLREKYADEVYTIKRNGKKEELTGREYWKEENVHYHILKHCIYGADIDSFAVQLTTINLLLKDLDNFTDELNIVECDSLIKWEEDYDWQDLKEQLKEEFETVEYIQQNLLGEEEKIVVTQRKESFTLKYKDILGLERTEKISRERAEKIVNLCEFWSKRFDYVVGNPPYVRHEKIKNKNYLELKYKIFNNIADIYTYFFERGMDILKQGSRLGLIVSNKFTRTNYGRNLRKYISENFIINRYVDEFGHLDLNEVFEDATVDACIILLDKKRKQQDTELIYNDNIFLKNSLFTDKSWVFEDVDILKIKSKIETKGKKIKEIDDIKINRGILTGFNEAFIIDEITKDRLISEDNNCKKIIKPVLRGRDIGRYMISYKNLYIINTGYNINIKEDYPVVYNYLLSYERQLKERYDKGNNWYNLRACDFYNDFESPKIIYAEIINTTPNRPKFVYDDEKYYIEATGFMISNYKNYNLLLAILNSTVSMFYIKLIGSTLNTNGIRYKKTFLKEFPIIENGDQALLNEIYRYIDKIKSINKNIKISLSIEEFINYQDGIDQINIYAERIDKLIMKLYGISKNEYILMLETLELSAKEELKNNDMLSIIEPDERIYYIDKLSQVLSKEKFIEEHCINGKSIEKISDEYGYEYETVVMLRNRYTRGLPLLEKIRFYNLCELFNLINKKINDAVFYNLDKNKNYTMLENARDIVVNDLNDFEAIMDIMRLYDSTKKTINVVKEALNSDSYTWNAYRKAKAKGKVNKTFVKYYDNKYYGLAEWSDEIHKKYFLDAIEEYTVNNPNEKKAKDILKLFKDLDIEDKQDYIEIIEGKIKRAFH